MKIKIFQNRKVDKDYFYNEGTSNENAATTLSFELPLGYEDFEKKIVFLTESGNFWDKISDDNTYTIKNNITIFEEVDAYVWLKKDEMDFRTEQFKLNFNSNENPDFLIPDEVDKEEIGSLVDVLNLKIKEVEDLKDDINDTLTQLKDYDTQLANVEKQVQDIADYQSKVIDQLKKEFEVKDFSGTNTHITDSAEFPILDLGINGGIEQDSREGYNLIEPIMESATSNGVTCTNNKDGTFTLNGTSTARTTFRLDQHAGGTDNLKNYDDGDYELSLGVINSNLRLVLMQNLTWNSPLILPVNTEKYHAPITNATDCFIYVDVYEGATFNNVVIEPMFRKYNNDNKPFEQYGSMPSISFPSEVKGVSGHYDNVVENKNRFSFDKAILKSGSGLGVTFEDKKFTMATQTGTWSNAYVMFKNPKKNGYISISADFLETAIASKKGISIYGGNYPELKDITNLISVMQDVSLNTKKRIGAGANTGDYEYILIRFWDNATETALTTKSNCIVDNIQMEIGEPTEFIEHQEQNLPLDIPFNMYSGKPYKENGKWYRPIEWYKEKITSSNVLEKNTYGINCYGLSKSYDHNMDASAINILSNYFKGTTYNKRAEEISDSIYGEINNAKFTIRNIPFATIEEFKTFLDSNDVYIVYKLATPTIEEITDTTLIAQLEELQKAHSYYEVTNINSYGSEDAADLVLSGKYYVSNKARIENLEKAILSLGGNI